EAEYKCDDGEHQPAVLPRCPPHDVLHDHARAGESDEHPIGGVACTAKPVNVESSPDAACNGKETEHGPGRPESTVDADTGNPSGEVQGEQCRDHGDHSEHIELVPPRCHGGMHEPAADT